MPNIEEFNAKGTIDPSDRGIQAELQVGRRVGQFWHQIGQDISGTISGVGDAYNHHQEAMEVSSLYKTGTDLQNNLSTAWQQYSSDPANRGNPDLAKNFMEQHVTPVLDEWASHAQSDTGKRIAAEMAARISGETFRRSTADQSALDATTAHQNLVGTLNGLGSQVINDPSSADRVIGAGHTAIDNMIPSSVAPAERATMQRELYDAFDKQTAAAFWTSAAAVGAEQIAANGTSPSITQAREAYAAGKFRDIMSPEAYARIPDILDQAERAGHADAERVQRGQQQAAELKSQAKSGAYLTALSTADASDPTFTADWNRRVLSDPDLLPAARDSLFSMRERVDSAAHTQLDHGNPDLLNSMLTRIGSTRPPSQSEIIDTVGKPGGLSQSQADFALAHLVPKTPHDELDNKMLTQSMDLWKTSLRSPINTGMPDVDGARRYTDAMNYYVPLIRQGEANGTPLVELLAPPGKDHPNSVYNSRPIDSFNPPPASPAGHPTPAHSNAWDSVVRLWQQAVTATSGGSRATAPIEGSPAVAPPSATPSSLDPQTRSQLDDIWKGK